MQLRQELRLLVRAINRKLLAIGLADAAADQLLPLNNQPIIVSRLRCMQTGSCGGERAGQRPSFNGAAGAIPRLKWAGSTESISIFARATHLTRLTCNTGRS